MMAVLAGSKGNLSAELLRNAENEGEIEGVSYVIFIAQSLVYGLYFITLWSKCYSLV